MNKKKRLIFNEILKEFVLILTLISIPIFTNAAQDTNSPTLNQSIPLDSNVLSSETIKDNLEGELISNTIEKESSDDQVKINEILENKRNNCAFVEPTTTPGIKFEIVNPKVILNKTGTQISMQMKVIYYRCDSDVSGESKFTPINPGTPFQYSVNQLDETSSLVKVSQQVHQFRALLGEINSNSPNIGLRMRDEISGFIHKIHFDVPVKNFVTSELKKELKKGNTIQKSIRINSALSTNYKVGSQSEISTGMVPGTSYIWEIEVQSIKGKISLFLKKVKTIN